MIVEYESYDGWAGTLGGYSSFKMPDRMMSAREPDHSGLPIYYDDDGYFLYESQFILDMAERLAAIEKVT